MNKLHRAILFASEAHKNQRRKGTDIEYFTHPVEVMQILTSMNASEDLQVAGLLHDVVEDTEISVEVIRSLFGEKVAELVENHTHKANGKSWKERRQEALDDLAVADRETQLLVLADKVANLRSMTYDYSLVGERLWKRFSAPKELQSWYYSEAQDILCDMQDDPDAMEIYWEFVHLYKDLFVTYYLDEEETAIYQVACGLGGYVLTRDDPEWYPMEEPLPMNVEAIPRKEAEDMENFWFSRQEEPYHDGTLDGNELLEEAISDFRRNEDKASLEYLAEVIARRIEARGHVIMPIEDGIEEGHVSPRTITTDDGEVVIAAFTNQEEMKKGPYSEVLSIRIEHLFAVAKELDFVGGIVLNPWGEFMYVGKDLISIIEEQVELPDDGEEDGELTVEFVEIPTDKKLLN